MGGCIDKRFEQMLYAYELSILSEEETRQFELHLYECDHCFDRVERFQHAARRIREDPRVRESVQRMAADQPEKEVRLEKEKAWGDRRRRLIKVVSPLLAAAAILLILILTDWQLEFRPSQEAVAVENRLAVMYFENVTDPENSTRLGEIITNLLITDLAESQYIQVVSSQRLHDILKLQGFEGAQVLDRETASSTAREARAEWMLTGSILQVQPQLVITSQLVEVLKGNAIASQQIMGGADETIFAVVDRLSAAIKSDLALPPAARDEPDRSVADVTTHSTEAYRHYLDGVEYINKYYWAEARQSFEKALEFDSTFAMAYYYLAIVKDPRLIEKAVQYAGHAGQKEQLFIRSRQAAIAGDLDSAIATLEEVIERYPDEKEALLTLGNHKYEQLEYEAAVRYLATVVKIDSLDKRPYNMLAYAHNKLGDFDRALRAIEKYIELAPGEANPYDTRGEIYAGNGRLDSAIASYQAALAIKPDFVSSLMYLGIMNVFKGHYARAESCFQEFLVISSGHTRPAGRLYLTYAPVHQGKFTEALCVLDDAITADRLERSTSANRSYALKYLAKARIYVERNEMDRAVKEFEDYINIRRRDFPDEPIPELRYHVQLLAEAGNSALAQQVADEMKNSLEESGQGLDDYWYAMGCLELSTGSAGAAVAYFEKILDPTATFPERFMLARAYQEAGELERAATQFEELLAAYTSPRSFWGIWSVKTHYFLGQVDEQLGRLDEAAEQYRTFLEIWKDADPGIPEVDDAKERLAGISQT